MNKTLSRRIAPVLLAALALAPAAWSLNLNLPFLGKKASSEEKSALAQAFEGKYAVPKTDLPRGTYEQRGFVVDFAEIERLRLINGAGPRAGTVLQIDSATVSGGKVKILVREPNKRPDPRGLALVLRPAKGDDFADYLDTARLHETLSKLFTLSDAPPVAHPTPPIYAAMPAPAAPPPVPAPAKSEAPKAALEIGMSKKAVLDLLGEPHKRDVEFAGDVVVERLFYEFSDHTSMLLILRDGVVEQIKRF